MSRRPETLHTRALRKAALASGNNAKASWRVYAGATAADGGAAPPLLMGAPAWAPLRRFLLLECVPRAPGLAVHLARVPGLRAATCGGGGGDRFGRRWPAEAFLWPALLSAGAAAAADDAAARGAPDAADAAKGVPVAALAATALASFKALVDGVFAAEATARS